MTDELRNEAAERYVRSVWDRSEMCESEGPVIGSTMFCLSLGTRARTVWSGEWVKSKTEAWLAAEAFTREKQREVAEIEEEIATISIHCGFYTQDEDTAAYTRIKARLEQALTLARRGMRLKEGEQDEA